IQVPWRMNEKFPLYQASKNKGEQRRMISIGMQAAKNMCIATLKCDTSKILEQLTFYNNTKG
ncbi:MAG: hypothetical protein V3T40_05150, partial [Nitrososphaerales archaeon]